MLTQSLPTLCDPMDCSPPGSSVHGIFQARILRWVAISFSRELSWPRDQIHISCVSCIGRESLFHRASWEAPTVPTLSSKETWGDRINTRPRRPWSKGKYQGQKGMLHNSKRPNLPGRCNSFKKYSFKINEARLIKIELIKNRQIGIYIVNSNTLPYQELIEQIENLQGPGRLRTPSAKWIWTLLK